MNFSKSFSKTSCIGSSELDPCRDDKTALILKFGAISLILLGGTIGVAIPLVGKNLRFLKTESNLFFATKAFAAGVILATGFVHMLPEATEALTNQCLPETPWAHFPFSGFIAMMAALTTFLVDFVSTQYYESKQVKKIHDVQDVLVDSDSESLIGQVAVNEKVFGEENDGGIHIVGMHAHAAHHSHNHVEASEYSEGHSHMHSHGFSDVDDDDSGIRHAVVSQVVYLISSCSN